MATVVLAPSYGGPEVLTVVERPDVEPADGEVAIEVRAVGTNPVDYKLFSGSYGADPSQLPLPVGSEAAGVVTAVGLSPVGPAGPVGLGDEVVAYRITGAYASRVVVPATAVVPKPSNLSFEQAGGLMLCGTTAVHTLVATSVADGDTVVIHGATGGVGLMAVQLAVQRGARVIGTARESGHATLRELGADPVVYGEGLLQRISQLAPDGVDAAIDMVGTDEAIDVSVALVEDRSRIATIAGFQKGMALGIKVLGGAPGADPGTELRAVARLQLVDEVEAGRLTVLVAGTYPLTRASQALGQLATGHTQGKIVLVP